MPNRFKTNFMRHHYDAAIRAYQTKNRNLFTPDGRQRRGSTFACTFWDGFNGKPGPGIGYAKDREARTRIDYAFWRAGQDCAVGTKHDH